MEYKYPVKCPHCGKKFIPVRLLECRYCGKDFSYEKSGGAPRRYCSDACKALSSTKYNKKYRKEKWRDYLIEKVTSRIEYLRNKLNNSNVSLGNDVKKKMEEEIDDLKQQLESLKKKVIE